MPAAIPTALKLASSETRSKPSLLLAQGTEPGRIVAVDRETGAVMASVSVRAIDAAHGPVLVLDAVSREPRLIRQTALLPKMLAAALLRQIGTMGAPTALAVLGADPLLFVVLARVAAAIGAPVVLPNVVADLPAIHRARALHAALSPPPPGAALCLTSGAVTHGGLWHGRRLMVADCAALAEDDIIRAARKMLRLREGKLNRVPPISQAAPSSRPTPPNCRPSTTPPTSPSRRATPAAR